MRFLLLLSLCFASALSAQYTVTSGAIVGGYTDLALKTDVSGGSAAPMSNNDGTGAISPQGFDFPCFGAHYTSFGITDNGYIVLGQYPPMYPYVTPTPDYILPSGPVIAPMWCDLDPAGNMYGYGNCGQIAWHFAGNVLTVEWKYVERMQTAPYTMPAPGVRMQAVLDCGNGVIEMRYGDPDPDCWGKNANWDLACSIGHYYGQVVGTDSPFITSTGRVFQYPIDRYVRFTPTVSPLHITDDAFLPDGHSGYAYSKQFTAMGGVPGYTWGASNLPTGWTMSTTGLLQAPAAATVPGAYTFTVTANDQGSHTHSREYYVAVQVGAVHVLNAPTLPHGVDGVAYSLQFAALGGNAPYAWDAAGLPAGWSMSPAGLLSAAAQDVAWGSYSFDVEVSDSATPVDTASLTVSLAILPPAITVTTTSVGPFTAGAPAQATLYASGGAGSLAWSAVSLPAGWSVSADGVLSAAAQHVTAGQHAVTVEVTDQSAQAVQASWTVDVIPPGALSITTGPTLPAVAPGSAIGVQFNATGGIQPYAWGASGLPAGWSLSATGQLTAPAAMVTPGTYTFTASVTDGAVPATTDSRACTLIVAAWPALAVSAAALPDALIGQVYAQSLSANGGTGSGYQWSVTGALPAGITASAGAGPAIGFTGTATQSGVYGFSVEVSDDGGNTLTLAMSITVQAASVTKGGGTASGGGCTSSTGTLLVLPMLLLAAVAAARRRRAA